MLHRLILTITEKSLPGSASFAHSCFWQDNPPGLIILNSSMAIAWKTEVCRFYNIGFYACNSLGGERLLSDKENTKSTPITKGQNLRAWAREFETTL